MDCCALVYILVTLLASIVLTILCGYAYLRWYKWTRSSHILCYALFLILLSMEYVTLLPLLIIFNVPEEMLGIVYGSSGILKSVVLVYVTFFAED